jgi:hypothetical protein
MYYWLSKLDKMADVKWCDKCCNYNTGDCPCLNTETYKLQYYFEEDFNYMLVNVCGVVNRAYRHYSYSVSNVRSVLKQFYTDCEMRISYDPVIIHKDLTRCLYDREWVILNKQYKRELPDDKFGELSVKYVIYRCLDLLKLRRFGYVSTIPNELVWYISCYMEYREAFGFSDVADMQL